MHVRLRFFASLREKLHSSEAPCTLPDGATVHDLLEQLSHEYPPLADVRRALRVAVNQEYVESDHALCENDEVALIPPVSGGVDVRDC
ncbi:MAG: molybdopterin converting factor subunit 1 [Gaiellaceae bacterium]